MKSFRTIAVNKTLELLKNTAKYDLSPSRQERTPSACRDGGGGWHRWWQRTDCATSIRTHSDWSAPPPTADAVRPTERRLSGRRLPGSHARNRAADGSVRMTESSYFSAPTPRGTSPDQVSRRIGRTGLVGSATRRPPAKSACAAKQVRCRVAVCVPGPHQASPPLPNDPLLIRQPRLQYNNNIPGYYYSDFLVASSCCVLNLYYVFVVYCIFVYLYMVYLYC